MSPPRVIFGGSFNPLHVGHLAMARAAHAFIPEARVALLPAGEPPHKRGASRLPFSHRAAMLDAIAAAEGPWLEVCRVEAEREGPTYTIDTIRLLKRRLKAPLYFLIGGDSLRDLSSWREWRALVSEAQLLIASRPGVDTEAAFAALAPELPEAQLEALRAHVLPMSPTQASSTEVRAALREGRDIAPLLPPLVLSYLRDHALLDDLRQP